MNPNKSTIKLSEMFGPTLQGEGAKAGRLAAFIRVFGCPLYCWFCDTPYTWRFSNKHDHKNEGMIYDPKEQVQEVSYAQILANLEDMDWPLVVVFTGGEPLLYDQKLFELGQLIMGRNPRTQIEVETAGTIRPDWLSVLPNCKFNVSPKLASSRVSLTHRYAPDVLLYYVQYTNSIFKFVVVGKQDIVEIRYIQKECKIANHRIYLMPEGETLREQIAKMKPTMEWAIANGWNFSPRLHTLAWGNERGK